MCCKALIAPEWVPLNDPGKPTLWMKSALFDKETSWKDPRDRLKSQNKVHNPRNLIIHIKMEKELLLHVQNEIESFSNLV